MNAQLPASESRVRPIVHVPFVTWNPFDGRVGPLLPAGVDNIHRLCFPAAILGKELQHLLPATALDPQAQGIIAVSEAGDGLGKGELERLTQPVVHGVNILVYILSLVAYIHCCSIPLHGPTGEVTGLETRIGYIIPHITDSDIDCCLQIRALYCAVEDECSRSPLQPPGRRSPR